MPSPVPETLLLAAPRSFCAGVERAIEIVEHALAHRGRPVYVRKQIVHNAHVVADLEARGAVFVDELTRSVTVPDPERVSYLTQTTLAVDETTEILAGAAVPLPVSERAGIRRHLLRHNEPAAGVGGGGRRRRPGDRGRVDQLVELGAAGGIGAAERPRT